MTAVPARPARSPHPARSPRSVRPAGWLPQTGMMVAVALAAAVVAIGAVQAPALDAVAIPVVFGLLVVLATCRALLAGEPLARRVTTVAVALLGAHLVIGVAIHSSPSLIQYLGGDAVTYNQGAQQIVAHWRNASTPLPPISPGKEGFYYLLAGLYWAFGSFSTAGLAINAMFSAALVPVMFDLTKRLFGARAGWWAALIVGLQPGFLIWTSQLLREAGIMLMLGVALNCAVRLADRARPSTVVVLAVDLTVLLTFRADVAITVAGCLAVALVLGHRQAVGRAAVVAAVAAIMVVLVAAVGIGNKGYTYTRQVNLQKVNIARQELSVGVGSGFDSNADVSTTGGIVSYLPSGLPSFLLGPFPWDLHNARQALGGLEALTVMAMVVPAWRGWRAARLSRGSRRLLLLPAVGLAVSLALVIGNYGTVVRERLQVLVFLIPLVAVGIASRERAQEPDGSRRRRLEGRFLAGMTSPAGSPGPRATGFPLEGLAAPGPGAEAG